MSFHYTQLGDFGQDLQCYADIDGYVPEPGDRYEEFDWPLGSEWLEDRWVEWLEEVEEATARALQDLAHWQSS